MKTNRYLFSAFLIITFICCCQNVKSQHDEVNGLKLKFSENNKNIFIEGEPVIIDYFIINGSGSKKEICKHHHYVYSVTHNKNLNDLYKKPPSISDHSLLSTSKKKDSTKCWWANTNDFKRFILVLDDHEKIYFPVRLTTEHRTSNEAQYWQMPPGKYKVTVTIPFKTGEWLTNSFIFEYKKRNTDQEIAYQKYVQEVYNLNSQYNDWQRLENFIQNNPANFYIEKAILNQLLYLNLKSPYDLIPNFMYIKYEGIMLTVLDKIAEALDNKLFIKSLKEGDINYVNKFLKKLENEDVLLSDHVIQKIRKAPEPVSPNEYRIDVSKLKNYARERQQKEK